MRRPAIWAAGLCLCGAMACSSTEEGTTPEAQNTPDVAMSDMGSGTPDATTPGPDGSVDMETNRRPDGPWIAHQFPDYSLEPFEETQPCLTWKLNNEKALYVRAVTLFNEGAWHHSNWFVVPDNMYEGDDGLSLIHI